MKVTSLMSRLDGRIRVPASKSHTIRALLLASLAEGTSRVRNPLPSADCLSTAHAVPLIGAKIDLSDEKDWRVRGAGDGAHLPTDVINVGNSGSLLYFMSPIASTFPGTSVFTGDESIRRRPVGHVADALRQMGCDAFCADPSRAVCPLIIRGPSNADNVVRTDGVLSQYVSGMMMAATRLSGTLRIELSDPKETPYLTMTEKWLRKVGVEVCVSDDFKHIEVKGPHKIQGFDEEIPSDWEAVAFPLVAALVTDSSVTIENIDLSGTQGDEAIVEVLKSTGADIELDRAGSALTVRGGSRSKNKGYLSTRALPGGALHVNLSGFPDAVCALAAVSCFIDGEVHIEDIGVCRKKETDRIQVLRTELTKLGADVEEGPDYLIIRGSPPVLPEGGANPAFRLHGGEVLESFRDHRLAMAFSSIGLAFKDGVTVNDAECAAVSFPRFYETMKALGASFDIS